MSQRAAAGVVRISVCVPTRNRGVRIVPLLESLRQLDYDSFEVVVVDQSTDAATEQVYRDTVSDDPRFSYTASSTVGKSAACNVALARSLGSIIAFTDDDCVARSDWLTGIDRAFAAEPEAAAICGAVVPGEYDADTGHIPVFMPTRARLYRSKWTFYRVPVSLMGANIAFRADALRAVAGFDEAVGPGGPFKTGDDYDIVYRLLWARRAVLVLPGSAIVHYGFRANGPEMRSLAWDCAVAHGAIYMRQLRLGDPAILPALVVRLVGDTVRWPNLLRLRGPTGLGRLLAFTRGMANGFRYPLDRETRTYAPRRLAQGRSHSRSAQEHGVAHRRVVERSAAKEESQAKLGALGHGTEGTRSRASK